MRIRKTASRFLLTVALVFVLIVAGFGISIVRRGFSARETPSAVERLAAASARQLALPFGYRGLRNPFPATPENIRAGMEHFSDHCASCHANSGSGDTLFGKGLYPKPPDMRAAETQNKADGDLYYAIENGIRLSGMPAFGERPGTGDEETWKLVVFIRHLPALTSAELAEMAALNPKTEGDRQEEKEEQDFLQGAERPGTNAGEAPGATAGETHHHH